MLTQQNEIDQMVKLMGVFYTMRTNLAISNSFLRMSSIDESLLEHEEIQLGLVGNLSSKAQIKIHNTAVTRIAAALLYQTLNNYFEMTRIKAELKDKDLEATLDQIGNRDVFIQGLRIVRNMVFHVKNINLKEQKILSAFDDIVNQYENTLDVLIKIREALYDFTEKCFMGELRIFPDQTYDDDLPTEKRIKNLKDLGVDEETARKILSKPDNNQD